ncbi:MAG: domain S-box-containing protein/diguanylate cyclase protein [Solirubrobacterales bacterium]|nr:domain S-box-containing protein/diguanylate cyclase protein [Solirubrobacterales bacterium]
MRGAALVKTVPTADSRSPTPSSAGSERGRDATDEAFESERQEHLDAETLETVLDSLLTRYPEAPVAVLKADGVSIPVPESIALVRNRVLEARSGLDMVVQEDRLRLLATWDQVLAKGSARCLAHLAEQPETTVALYGLDLREAHGVVLVLYAPTDEVDASAALVRRAPKPPPRFSTIEKDERSFIVKTDDALTEILGWAAEEMHGRRSIEFMHPDDHALAIDNWMEMLASPGPGRRVRLRHRHRNGSWVWFEVTNHNMLDDPGRNCVVAEIVDISDEMAAQEELRAREQLLDRLAEAIPLGLFQVDAAGAIVYTNDRLHEILGVQRVTSFEAQMASVVESDQAALRSAMDDVLGAGRHADVEVELRFAGSDEARFCSINLRALTHEDGTISGAIACVADVTDSARMRDELKRRATFDELTGCHNRASFMRALEANVAAAQPDAERALMFVDLDRFKDLNDRYGHATGDELLRILGARLRATVRGGDMVGRIGGDEFLVMCPQAGGSDGAMRLAERLAQALREPVALVAGSVWPQVSIGVAWSQGHGTEADAIVAQADAAMYQSKRQGAGRPQLAAAVAGAPALTSPVELVRAAAGDRSLRSSSEQARPLRSA